MKRWMAFAGLGLAAIVLAFLLLERPDTGGVQNPAPGIDGRQTLGSDPLAKGGGEVRPDGVGRAASRHAPILKNGPSPIAVENIRRLNVPDALYAGRLTSPLAVVRRQLQLLGDPGAATLATKADELIGQLREQRRDPEAHSMPDLIVASRTWLEEVKASQWGAHAEIAPQFARYEQIVVEYEQAKANPDQPIRPPGGAPGQPTAPVPAEGE